MNLEKRKIMQECLKRYSDFAKVINKNNKDVSEIFAGAINYANIIFINHLCLGGAYQDTENFEEIRKHLSKLIRILSKND